MTAMDRGGSRGRDQRLRMAGDDGASQPVCSAVVMSLGWKLGMIPGSTHLHASSNF